MISFINNLNDIININLTMSIFYIFFVASCFGSFFNVVLYRYPIIFALDNINTIIEYITDELKLKMDLSVLENEKKKYPDGFSLSKPSSHCPKCNNKIKFYYNIPILGYFLSKMKCSQCGNKISFFYPFIELLTATIITSGFYMMKDNQFWLIFLIFLTLTWLLALIDFKTLMLPDSLNYVLIWFGLLATASHINFFNISLENSIYGTVIGFLIPFSINYIGKKLKGFDVIGGGDFKLLAGIGAFIGIKGAIFTFFISPFLGILTWIFFTIYNSINKIEKDNQRIIPFGPSLIFTSWIFIFYGEEIIRKIIP